MKVYKKIILIMFLVYAGAPLYAMESSDELQSAPSFVASLFAPAKKSPALLFVAAAAVGAGLYLYKAVRGAKVYKIPGVVLNQVPVLDQFASAAHGGGASCGYQALKNGICLVRSFFDLIPITDLTDLAIVQQLFNKQEPFGLWRILVLENSSRRAIKWMIDDALYKCMISPQNLNTLTMPQEVQALDHKLQERFREKIRGYYQGVLGDELSPQLVTTICDRLKDQDLTAVAQEVIAVEQIITAIKKSERVIDHDIDGLENFDFLSHAKADQTIARYLPYLLDGKHIAGFDSAVQGIKLKVSKASAMRAYNKKYPDSGFNAQADWINENEIAQVIAYERHPDRLLAGFPAEFDGVTVIDNVMLLDRGEGLIKDISEIRDRLLRNQNFVHIFVVGLMNGQPGKESGQKHWVTLVVRKENGIAEWIVTDSAGNASRLNDPIIWTLIKHLIKSS